MALFTRLFELRTNSIENYFTEIVAYLFRTNPDILYAWLKHINLIDTNLYIYAPLILTQQKHDPLEHHLIGSRPDIILELLDSSSVDIIFIESKVDAEEHNDQLQRYAEILDERLTTGKKILLYVTRDFDPKDERVVLKGVSKSTIHFKQVRWNTLYQVLQIQPHNTLLDEVLVFMKEHHMGRNNRFSEADIISLSNLPKHYILIDELMDITLGGKISERFKEVVGKIESRKITLDLLKEYGRYLIYALFQDLWCGLGYHLNQNLHAAGIPGTPPTVSLILEVSPTSRQRPLIIQAMQEIATRPGWRGYNLDGSGWSGVICERNLQDFLSEEDQVVAISSYFMHLLDELAEIRDRYSSLIKIV